jgi:glycosyltransferase involved in cell wall biosynthesis
MHDCWTFTGGCHHFYSCSNFQRNCGTCEVLDSSNTKDLSSYMYCIKSRAYNKNTTFVAISDWMLNSAKKSTLLKDKNIIKIVSGINTNIFKYIDRNYARETENFDFNSKIVLIGAQSLNSLSKGFDFTIQALNKFNKYPLTILAFGDGDIVLKNPLHKIINLGYINNPYKMANIFSMSDIFISTAVVESFGMAIAEAQCCGLPAIIFDNTGPVEIVDNMKTGYIAKHSDVDDIINGINFCFNYKFNRSNISSNSINKFSINITTKEYIYEYNKLVTNNKL